MKFRYIVKRFYDIRQRRPKVFHEPSLNIESYCAIAAALNLGIVQPIEFAFVDVVDHNFTEWQSRSELCIVRERMKE